jgi:16S rRNA (cytidine1402-2'-O)-methyltransferase
VAIVAGTLYVVATPIGNLEDLTLRALRILRDAHLIAAEDTRRTRILLAHHGITTPTTSYYEQNKWRKGPELLRLLLEGKSVALVTDAGTPGISDPGSHLVQLAHAAGIPIVPIPGPTAVAAALSVAGFPADRFIFEGFLPTRPGRRLARLRELQAADRTVVIYEGPHRLLKTLEAIGEVFGEVEMACCRELTKQFEEVRRGTPSTLISHYGTHGVRGECTLVLRGEDRAVQAKPDRSPS